MLSRSAAGLYWMGRYLERASHLSRLLRQQTESLVDRPVRDIYFGWYRIYGALDRQPNPGALELHTDDAYTLADSYTLADDLTFEPTNPDSIRNCFTKGRDNARQMRHHISAEMWFSLNRSYLRLQALEIQNIWVTSPESFYAQTNADIDTLWGVTDATMYRDQGWRFVQLGRFLERAQLSASLLAAQITAVSVFDEPADTAWTTLLRLYHAFEAYNRAYSAAIDPERVLDLLVTDPQLPDSLGRSISSTSRELVAIGAGPDPDSTTEVRRLAAHIGELVRREWAGAYNRKLLLDQILAACRRLHDLVALTYFEYPITGASAGPRPGSTRRGRAYRLAE